MHSQGEDDHRRPPSQWVTGTIEYDRTPVSGWNTGACPDIKQGTFAPRVWWRGAVQAGCTTSFRTPPGASESYTLFCRSHKLYADINVSSLRGHGGAGLLASTPGNIASACACIRSDSRRDCSDVVGTCSQTTLHHLHADGQPWLRERWIHPGNHRKRAVARSGNTSH